MSTVEDFFSPVENQWCPGCPNFGILTSMKQALAQLGKKPEDVCLVSGIGQAAKFPHYIKCHFYNGLHGRALPLALGIQISQPGIKTIVTTGDGDCYGEGGNHFIHTIRRNPNMTLIVHNNQIYGLTKGQASPTTDQGDKTRLQLDGVEIPPLKPLSIALIHGCRFVARGFAGDSAGLTTLFVEAIRFHGFAYVDVVQPCISWGTHPIQWYKQRIRTLPPDYDNSDWDQALKKSLEWQETIPVGILYKDKKEKPCFGDTFRDRVYSGPLSDLDFPPSEHVVEILNRFR